MRSYNDNHVSIERLREILSYCPETGTFTWKVSRGGVAKAGSHAGCVKPNGYRIIGIENKHFPAHRVAWAMHFGVWPERDIDHINRIGSDNRIANLRLATQSQNNANQGVYCTNRHGTKGVTPLRHGRWQAQIQVNGKNHYLGSFKSKEDAAAAYAAASHRFFGEFSSVGAKP